MSLDDRIAAVLASHHVLSWRGARHSRSNHSHVPNDHQSMVPELEEGDAVLVTERIPARSHYTMMRWSRPSPAPSLIAVNCARMGGQMVNRPPGRVPQRHREVFSVTVIVKAA